VCGAARVESASRARDRSIDRSIARARDRRPRVDARASTLARGSRARASTLGARRVDPGYIRASRDTTTRATAASDARREGIARRRRSSASRDRRRERRARASERRAIVRRRRIDRWRIWNLEFNVGAATATRGARER